jgi:hypothetical protein
MVTNVICGAVSGGGFVALISYGSSPPTRGRRVIVMPIVASLLVITIRKVIVGGRKEEGDG